MVMCPLDGNFLGPDRAWRPSAFNDDGFVLPLHCGVSCIRNFEEDMAGTKYKMGLKFMEAQSLSLSLKLGETKWFDNGMAKFFKEQVPSFKLELQNGNVPESPKPGPTLWIPVFLRFGAQ